jgi:hypothetical protein
VKQDLQRLFDGVIDSLRDLVLPQLNDEVHRGQLSAALAVLAELKLRTEWSRDWLLEQLDAQENAFAGIAEVLAGTSIEWTRPPFDSVDRTQSCDQLEILRDEGDRYLCLLQDQLGDNRAGCEEAARSVRDIILGYAKFQCGREMEMTPGVPLGKLQHDKTKDSK